MGRRALGRALGWLGTRLAFGLGVGSSRLSVAVQLQRWAVLVAGRHCLDFPLHLSNLGVTYEELHRRGVAGALTRAIAAQMTALARVGLDNPARLTITSNLGSALLESFDVGGAWRDLDRADVVLREAVAACPRGHGDRASILVNAAVALSFRLDHCGDLAAGHAAVDLCIEASGCLSGDDPLAADVDTLWGQLLHGMAEFSGSPSELDAAIDRLEAAVLRAQRSRGDTPHARTALARALRLRADRYGRLGDLTRAISEIEAALAETPAALAALRGSRLASLAVAQASRFHWTRDAIDIDEAALLFDQLAATDGSRGSQHRANLAVCLTQRASSTHARPDDLDRAIELLRVLRVAAVEFAPDAAIGAALADALLDRAEATDSQEDLGEAHRMAAEAVRQCPPGSPALARYLGTLGEAELARFEVVGDGSALEAAVCSYAEAFAVEAALPRERVRAALLWAHCAATATRWAEALAAHDRGHSLIPRLLAPDLLPTDGLRLVEDLAEAGPDAIALSLMEGGQADLGLVRAEQWRGLVLGADRLRRQLWGDLLDEHPRLGGRLQSVMARSGASIFEDVLLHGGAGS